VKVILAAVLRLPLRRTRVVVARSRVTRAGPAGLNTPGRAVDEEVPTVLGDPIGGGAAAGLPGAGAGVLAGVPAEGGVTAGVAAAGGVTAGGVTAGGVGTETDGRVTRGGGGGGGSGAGGVVAVGSVTVGSDTVIGGRPTWPRARAESAPAVAAAQKRTSVRARVERRNR
jgi:hypothetical protein